MAAPTRSAYPTSAELQAFLEGCGITVVASLSAQFTNFLNSALAELENKINRTILAPASETKYFDPPMGRDQILFIPDMCSVTSVVYTPLSGTSTTFTANDDYFLQPYDALSRYRPYTQIQFDHKWYGPLLNGSRRSLAITGRYGYWTAIPDDIYQAVMYIAATNALMMAGASASAGVESKKIEDFEVRYGNQPYNSLVTSWKGTVSEVINDYRRIVIC